MKKLALSLLTCSLLTLSFASCGNKSEEPPAEAAESATEEITTEDPEAKKKSEEAAQETVKKYYEAMFSGDSVKMGKISFPQETFEYLKSENRLEAEMKVFQMRKYDIEVDDVTFDKTEELSDTTLRGAETYFERYASVFCQQSIDITVVDGYEITSTVTVKSGDETESTTKTYIVVKLAEEEEPKLIATEASELDTLAD